MGKIIFILGGARSGKSRYAINLAKEKAKKKVVFIATAKPEDKEMNLRIRLHKKNRPSFWKTIEEPCDLILQIKKIKNCDLIIIDCLTLFISNLLLEGYKDAKIKNEIKRLLGILKKSFFESIIVSNEVGLGIVPDNPLARRFRDLAGIINQKVARAADKVYFMIAGRATEVK